MKHVNHSPALLQAIDQLLSQSPAGLSEYALIEALDKQYPSLFPKPNFTEKVLLFQHHFMLRHCLYRLQTEYAHLGDYCLDISLVMLVKRPVTDPKQGLNLHDPLREYYLDLSNMNKESESSIEALLNAFWTQLTHFIAAPEAHKILGLTGNESHQEKQQQYRKLAQRHHPDKGGNTEDFDKIQQAWQSIRNP